MRRTLLPLVLGSMVAAVAVAACFETGVGEAAISLVANDSHQRIVVLYLPREGSPGIEAIVVDPGEAGVGLNDSNIERWIGGRIEVLDEACDSVGSVSSPDAFTDIRITSELGIIKGDLDALPAEAKASRLPSSGDLCPLPVSREPTRIPSNPFGLKA